MTAMLRNHVITEPAETATLPAADRSFGFLVHDVSRLVKRRFERAVRHTGLPITRRQAAVLLYVARKEGVSQAEVANWLDIEPIALVRMLDKLYEERLVERRAHPTDRRVRTLWLMPAARPVVERILEINLSIREEAFAGLPAGAREALIAALASVKDNLLLQEEASSERSGGAELTAAAFVDRVVG
ncbi:MAG: MarR family transcriptional regulator [Alphaproteobacteria bacterium]|nr:MarR family transcriptional regulator [Alphaproteobacteria bacterium]